MQNLSPINYKRVVSDVTTKLGKDHTTRRVLEMLKYPKIRGRLTLRWGSRWKISNMPNHHPRQLGTNENIGVLVRCKTNLVDLAFEGYASSAYYLYLLSRRRSASLDMKIFQKELFWFWFDSHIAHCQTFCTAKHACDRFERLTSV